MGYGKLVKRNKVTGNWEPDVDGILTSSKLAELQNQLSAAIAKDAGTDNVLKPALKQLKNSIAETSEPV